MIGATRYDEHECWRESAVGMGWWRTPDPRDPERSLYSGPDEGMARDVAEWAARDQDDHNKEGEA